MEGRPWLRILLIIAGFLLLGLPVWNTTRKRPAVEPVEAQAATPVQALRVEVSFTHPPAAFHLEYLGQILCAGAAPDLDFACDWPVAVPKEGVDLLLKAHWPMDAPRTAIRVAVSNAGDRIADQTFWTQGSLVEIVTVPRNPP